MRVVVARQMIAAEVVKLRKNRALMTLAFLLTSGIVILVFGYKAIQHASDGSRYAPAGGSHGLGQAVAALGVYFGALSAILIGAEAGTADCSSGVFADLVATGRSRLALFSVRVPAAIIVTLAFSGMAFALSAIAAFVFAGGLDTPSLGLILRSAAWIALANSILAIVAVGVGSLSGSRAMTLTALIGWQTVATNLLIGVSSLGAARDGLLTPALVQLSPVSATRESVAMATGVAVTVMIGWAAVAGLLGAWRTIVRDA
jgi:hypothetical protein